MGVQRRTCFIGNTVGWKRHAEEAGKYRFFLFVFFFLITDCIVGSALCSKKPFQHLAWDKLSILWLWMACTFSQNFLLWLSSTCALQVWANWHISRCHVGAWHEGKSSEKWSFGTEGSDKYACLCCRTFIVKDNIITVYHFLKLSNYSSWMATAGAFCWVHLFISTFFLLNWVSCVVVGFTKSQ